MPGGVAGDRSAMLIAPMPIIVVIQKILNELHPIMALAGIPYTAAIKGG